MSDQELIESWGIVEELRNLRDKEGHSVLCCLSFHSDYNYVWNVHWSYSEGGDFADGHRDHQTFISKENFLDSLKQAKELISERFS